MRRTVIFRLPLPLILWAVTLAQASVLQEAIDAAPAGAILQLSAGLYEGPLRIVKPLSLVASEKGVVIRGNGKGSVITVEADQTTIQGLQIENSGTEHQQIDSGIAVKNASHVRLLNNSIRDCLFGINLEKSNESIIEGNRIESKPFSLGLKGDGIRLWYSHANTIVANETRNVRDNVFWYSSGNTIEANKGRHSRYSLHFMYADNNKIVGNDYQNNSVGIFLMYSHGVLIKKNLIANSTGPFGIGIGIKDTSDTKFEDNEVLYNARGFYIDSSPFQPGTKNTFVRNRIHYNSVAFQLHGTLFGSLFEDNVFAGNIDDVVNDTPESRIDLNRWERNTWDNYQGFDRNKDGYGDTPHEQWMFADRIWNYHPAAKVFYASPVLDFMNFLWRLMPFSEPELVARDNSPRIRQTAGAK